MTTSSSPSGASKARAATALDLSNAVVTRLVELMGGEIGIATGKMHARGPVGADQLTSFKYLVTGNGTIRN